MVWLGSYVSLLVVNYFTWLEIPDAVAQVIRVIKLVMWHAMEPA
jgi:hypothetical protein